MFDFEIYILPDMNMIFSVICKDPGSPINGGRQVAGFKIGHTVKFHCQKGFVLIGQKNMTCRNDGRWTGNVPKCSKNMIVYSLIYTAKTTK